VPMSNRLKVEVFLDVLIPSREPHQLLRITCTIGPAGRDLWTLFLRTLHSFNCQKYQVT
jgi:hypothetical protein